MGTVTGKQANIWLGGKAHSLWGISDFSLSFDRGMVEQELVGETGNWFDYGALSIDGSYTMCRFAGSGNSDSLESIVESSYVAISGAVDDPATDLHWYFVSCQVTSYEVSLGDADTISEASIDFVVMDPFNVSYTSGYITDT